MRSAHPQTGQPLDPGFMLNTLHHEGTHIADGLGGTISDGSATMRPADYAQLLNSLRSRNDPHSQQLAQWLSQYLPSELYMGNLGEIRARTAGATAPLIAPSDSTLRVFNKVERGSGRPLNFTTQTNTPSGWLQTPLPESWLSDPLFQIGRESPAHPGWHEVSKEGVDFGILDQRFRTGVHSLGGGLAGPQPGPVPSSFAGGRSAQVPGRRP